MTDNQIISNTKLEIIKASDIIISFIPAHLSWNKPKSCCNFHHNAR